MKNIFLSYSRRDIKRVEELRQALIGQGYRPWIDPNPRPGQDWRFEIDDAIKSADAMIVVITPESANSIYVTYEWAYAMGHDVPVVAVVFHPAPMHPRLQSLGEIFDVTGFTDENHFWDYFLREFNRLMAQKPTQQTSSPEVAQASGQPANRKPATAKLSPQIPAYDKSVMPTQVGYWLVVRRGPKLNNMYRLDKEIVSLGRDVANDIAINDPEVSRYHLRLVKQGDAYALEDLGSTNGTQINGVRVTLTTPLKDGDTIMLGDAIILSYDLVYSS